jgi:hypothetical protein
MGLSGALSFDQSTLGVMPLRGRSRLGAPGATGANRGGRSLLQHRRHAVLAADFPADLVAVGGEVIAEEAAAIGLALCEPAQLRFEAELRAEGPTESTGNSLGTDEAPEGGAVAIDLNLRVRQVRGADDRGVDRGSSRSASAR